MPKASPIQNAFNAGELTPLLLGRQDVEKYRAGLYTCYNAVPLSQGPWTRRGGSLFQHTTKFGGTRASHTLPFSYSITQNYILEFGHLYIRFHTLHGILIGTSQNVEGLTSADPGVVTITGHGYSNGQRLHFYDFDDGMEELNNQEFIVANSTANTFEITDIYGNDIDTTNLTAWVSGGKVAPPVEVTTTYTESELDNVTVTQDADTLYIFHPDHPIATLVRTSATTWTLADLDPDDGPYLAQNSTSTTLGLSGTTGSVTVTASAVTGINADQGFLSTDVGRLIRWEDPAGDWTWLEITAFTDTTHVTATIQGPDASASTATADWRLGLWSDTTGFPRCGTFHEDRLSAGGADISPQRFDMSRTGLYTSFSPSDADGTVTDDHAVSFSIKSDDVNYIFWMRSTEKALIVGTAGGEAIVTPSSLGEAITPTNITAKISTDYGSADVQPVDADKAILFVQRAARKLRELAYVFEQDGFKAPDMTLLAQHVTSPSVTRMAHQREPQSVVWAVRSDGVLLSFTYERDQNVLAWARHQLGGQSTAGGAAVEVESVAVIPTPDGDADEVYVIAKRYINGKTERYLEVLTKLWEPGDVQDDAFHLDCGGTDLATPASDTVVIGLHLEGEEVTLYVDGAVHPNRTVTNGKVTLLHTASTRTWGYSYNSDGETMPIEAGAADGTAQGKTKRIARLGFWLLDTLGLKFGIHPDTGLDNEILVREWGDEYGTPTALFTGVTRETFPGEYDRLGQIYWRADGPFPATVLAVMPQVTTNDDG